MGSTANVENMDDFFSAVHHIIYVVVIPLLSSYSFVFPCFDIYKKSGLDLLGLAVWLLDGQMDRWVQTYFAFLLSVSLQYLSPLCVQVLAK